MVKSFLTLLIVATMSLSCAKNTHHTDAQIIGYDISACGCCGGFMIQLSEDPITKFYLAKSLPSNVGIDISDAFPIRVEVDYEIVNNSECKDRFIQIKHLTRK